MVNACHQHMFVMETMIAEIKVMKKIAVEVSFFQILLNSLKFIILHSSF